MPSPAETERSSQALMVKQNERQTLTLLKKVLLLLTGPVDDDTLILSPPPLTPTTLPDYRPPIELPHEN
ncbi:hypothetical protein M1116_01820 [Patescibacteria group bacterium]|nr:hypothetical protein [Patescibacteria group bacterium]